MSLSKKDIIAQFTSGIGPTLLPGKNEKEYGIIDEVIVDEAEQAGYKIPVGGPMDAVDIFASRVRDTLLLEKSIILPFGIEKLQLQDYVRFRLTEIEFILLGHIT